MKVFLLILLTCPLIFMLELDEIKAGDMLAAGVVERPGAPEPVRGDTGIGGF